MKTLRFSNILLIIRRKYVFFAILSLFIIALNYLPLMKRAELGSTRKDDLSPSSLTRLKYEPVELTPSKAKSNIDMIFRTKFDAFISNYRRCLIEGISARNKNAWHHLHDAVAYCRGVQVWTMLDIRMLQNALDMKLVILKGGYVPSDDSECIAVTLGVGNDIEVEEKLRSLVPSCQFFGADPILSSGQVYKTIGHYSQVAVAAQSGVLKANVMENGRYYDRQVVTITFVDYLTSWIKVNRIDYLFIDTEGSEYGIFEQLLTDDVIERNNITVCQISVEMHAYKNGYVNITAYQQLITKLLRRSPFVPLWSQAATRQTFNHARSFYVNVNDAYCVRKYFQEKMFGL